MHHALTSVKEFFVSNIILNTKQRISSNYRLRTLLKINRDRHVITGDAKRQKAAERQRPKSCCHALKWSSAEHKALWVIWVDYTLVFKRLIAYLCTNERPERKTHSQFLSLATLTFITQSWLELGSLLGFYCCWYTITSLIISSYDSSENVFFFLKSAGCRLRVGVCERL